MFPVLFRDEEKRVGVKCFVVGCSSDELVNYLHPLVTCLLL